MQLAVTFVSTLLEFKRIINFLGKPCPGMSGFNEISKISRLCRMQFRHIYVRISSIVLLRSDVQGWQFLSSYAKSLRNQCTILRWNYIKNIFLAPAFSQTNRKTSHQCQAKRTISHQCQKEML